MYIVYIGVQRHSEPCPAADKAIESVRTWFKNDNSPAASESFNMIDGHDMKSTVIWVCYWTDEASYKSSLDNLSLSKLYASLPNRESAGLWLETFTLPVSRVETNYSGLDYLPGLAQLPDTTTEAHDLTAYWGAARDRIPDSAHDAFQEDSGTYFSKQEQEGRGKWLVGTNSDNLVHIRSGQYWQNCDEQESDSYEKKLEPTLEAGLQYLWHTPSAGAIGLRYLRNTDCWKETCAAGFFSSLGKLEGWAKSHKSHLAIYNGAMRHAKMFGDGRRFRTWHEVGVLKKGEGKFEYVNCERGTGVANFIGLEERNLDEI